MEQEIIQNGDLTISENSSYEAEIAELVEMVRSANERIAALESRVQDAKQQLRQLIEQRGSNWADSEGYARLVADAVRISYDTKALDELVIKDPLRNGWLKDFRRETLVSGGIHVK